MTPVKTEHPSATADRPSASNGNGSGKKRKKAPRLNARNANKHRLYEESVQCPEADVEFFDRVFQRTYGTKASYLREDFCGTAALCAEWIKARSDNRAIGIDLEPKVLHWGRRENIEPLGDEAKRIDLREGNVLQGGAEKVDIVAALNFSYFCFKERKVLIDYFRSVRESLRDRGLFVLDLLGGPDVQVTQEEDRDQDGFTYIWDQHEFNPITHDFKCFIHFRFKDGSEMRKAFSYEWRLWSAPELRDCMLEAGFKSMDVYWEGSDEDGEGDGVFKRSTKGDDSEAWIAYVVATP